MSGLKQTYNYSKHRNPEGRVSFEAHDGQQAWRYGVKERSIDDESAWPPERYDEPIFTFQVYLGVDLGLDDDERSTKKARVAQGSYRWTPTKMGRLKNYLTDPDRLQQPGPLWEFYTMPGSSVLEMVEHSRLEMLYRQRLHKAGDLTMPLIPLVASSNVDTRKAAFIFVIDNAEGWQDVSAAGKGPIWVQFDSRLPRTVTVTDRLWQMEDDPWMNAYQNDEFPMRFWPVQLELVAQRMSLDSATQACEKYNESVKPATAARPNAGLCFCDSSEPSHLEHPAVDALLKGRVSPERINESHARVLTSDMNIADIKYVVYVPFANEYETLEDAACQFTEPFLASNKSVEFDFYRLDDPSDAAILAAFRNLQPGTVGYRTALRADDVTTDSYHRLQPLSLNPHISLNDPASHKPRYGPLYTTCVIVVDRPDFAAKPSGVRIILTGDGHAIAADAEVSITIWRAPDMTALVKRLTFDQSPVHEEQVHAG